MLYWAESVAGAAAETRKYGGSSVTIAKVWRQYSAAAGKAWRWYCLARKYGGESMAVARKYGGVSLTTRWPDVRHQFDDRGVVNLIAPSNRFDGAISLMALG